jgi:CspA family cold shock protein
MAKQPGKIKLYDEKRGFGFIAPDDGSPDVFMHVSVCERCGVKPAKGMNITFEAELGTKGTKATWVG